MEGNKVMTITLDEMKKQFRTVLSAEQIAERMPAIAQAVGKKVNVLRHNGQDVVLVTVGRGADYFTGLIRLQQQLLVQADTIYVSSYDKKNVKGELRLKYFTGEGRVQGRHIIVIEDILQSGKTSVFVRDNLMSLGAVSVTFVYLVRKPDCVEVKGLDIMMVGFDIKDVFVFGCGMDAYGIEESRGFKSIGCLTSELPSKSPESLYRVPEEFQ